MQHIDKRLLSLKEIGQQTGLSKSKIYGLLRTGELTAIKVGRRTLISTDQLEAFLKRAPAYTSSV